MLNVLLLVQKGRTEGRFQKSLTFLGVLLNPKVVKSAG